MRLAGADAPISRHDTEEEAHAQATAYLRGLVSEATPPAPRAPGSEL